MGPVNLVSEMFQTMGGQRLEEGQRYVIEDRIANSPVGQKFDGRVINQKTLANIVERSIDRFRKPYRCRFRRELAKLVEWRRHYWLAVGFHGRR